ncbi:FHA domain-containing protein [Psychrobacter urativorans]|uniref:FHA domain-containing protein n=1 Tax=Psychrobacter urativorans TaxID=45610 RepID=A0A0M4TFK9_9GAMM|nr:FHA domain-containing protein [Psychrobacter urativorans]ALF60079.1 hypothetical protein AOC03_08545 [Psychrobacter urativorans]
MSNVNEHDKITAATNTADTKATSSEASNLEADIWQLNALTEALGDLSLTVIDSLSVGRGNDNDVVLGSKQVSRNHALLSVLNGKLYVKDLGSSNGTFINDDRVEDNKSKHLKADDTVGFASFAFKVTMAIAPTDSQPSIAEDASVVAAADTLVTEPEASAHVDTDTDTDTDLTYIGAIDTGVITNENVHTEVVNAEVVDSEDVDSSVLDATIMDAEITDAEVIDAEVIEDIAPSTATVEKEVEGKELEDKELESFEDFTTDAVTPDTVAEPEELLAAQPSVSSPVEPIVVEETVLDNNGLHDDVVDNTTAEEAVIHPDNAEHVVSEAVVSEAVVSDDVVSDDVVSDDVVSEDVVSEDVVIENTTAAVVENTIVKETIIEDVLFAAESQEHTPVAVEIEKPVTQEPALQQDSVVTPEHDKTTKTELQEEADPDVLRAKQAATGQLSGTANLVQTHDISTQDNKEIEQSVTNPANSGYVEKKSSGGWFIWVFIAIIIIGLALWLFNMGAA